MANNLDIKQHISPEEREKWNKNIDDFNNHLGAGGANNHQLGDGSVAGFSTNDYTNEEKSKLAGIEDGALNNPHPATHPYTMITGLGVTAHTNNYNDLDNKPTSLPANGGNSATVGGIRITINANAPSNPQNGKEIWINTNNFSINTYANGAWVICRGAYA